MQKMMLSLLCLLSAGVWADEKLLFGFENADLCKVNIKSSEVWANWTRCRVASVLDSNHVTLSLGSGKVAVGNEFVILHLGVYIGDVKVTAVDAATSTAKILAHVRDIAAGDSAMISATVHDTLTGNMSLAVIYHGTWNLQRGLASQGDYAMGLARVRTPAEFKLCQWCQPPDPLEPLIVAPETWDYYGMFQNGYMYFNTCGIFRSLFPKDWSAYDVLRMDVYAKDVNQTVQVAIEDEEIAPMVVRHFQAAADGWVTLEFDLRQAARDRKLDLTKMTGVHVAVREAPGKAFNAVCCLLDNIRLATTGTAVTYPVARDPASMALPAYYLQNTAPTPETMPAITPDRTPLALDTVPKIILTDTGLTFNMTGFVSAFDNKNLIAGFTKTVAYTMASNDGGAHWSGIQGEAGPTKLGVTYPTESTGKGEVVGGRGDVLLLTNNCSGGGHPGQRVAAYNFIFDGSRWGRSFHLVDSDVRHCMSVHSAAKTPDGRLWTSYGFANRLNTLSVNVHYSDNDGQTWKPSRENTAGVIPWSLVKPNPDTLWRAQWWAYGVSTEPTALVPWGNNSVACLLLRRSVGARPYPLLWSRLENGQWTPPDTIPVPKSLWTWSGYANSSHQFVKAVSLNGNELFVICSFIYGVFHYKDGVWTREAADIPQNSYLCVAGGRTLVAVGTTDTGDGLTPKTLKAWQYRSGSWSSPQVVVNEKDGIPFGAQTRMTGFAIPASSPANFVPLAWCTAPVNRVSSVKFIRIPVDTSGATAVQGPAPVLLEAALQIFPNPFSRAVGIRYAAGAKAAIYDVSGRCVWKAGVSKERPKLTWDSGKRARGIYLLKITAAGKLVRTETLIKL